MNKPAKLLGDQPAFPSEHPHAGGMMRFRGITLRAYLVAHAPAEPWPEFQPVVDWTIQTPDVHPKPDEGAERDDVAERRLAEWRRDPCWDAEEDHPTYSDWIAAWNDYWEESQLRKAAIKLACRTQWPAYWADRMLEELAK